VAVPTGVPPVVGHVGDEYLLHQIIRSFGITAIIHLPGSVVVPDSIADPLSYYKNNTVSSRTLLESAIK
jgi:UDP-glucose 4-epimerase